MATKARTRYDWNLIRAQYVEGVTDPESGEVTWPTLDMLAALHGPRPDTVRNRAAKEGWTEQRADFREQVEAEREGARQEQTARGRGSAAAELDNIAARAAKRGMLLVEFRLRDLSAAAKKKVEAGQPVRLSAQEMTRLASALHRLHGTGLAALGMAPGGGEPGDEQPERPPSAEQLVARFGEHVMAAGAEGYLQGRADERAEHERQVAPGS